MSKVEEKKVEAYLCRSIKLIGGEAYKFTSPNRRFVPDRLCVLPQGIIVFAEIKGEEGRLSSGQIRELRRLKEKGHAAFVIECKEDVDLLIMKLRNSIKGKTC